MRIFFTLCMLSLLMLNLACVTGPPENPDGKYGKEVPQGNGLSLAQILPKQGQYIDREIVIFGEIVEVDTLSGSWFDLKSGKDVIRCNIRDFGLPQSCVGKQAYAYGELTTVQVASETGRDPGQEYTFAADPSGASYKDELRLKIKGVKIVIEETSE